MLARIRSFFQWAAPTPREKKMGVKATSAHWTPWLSTCCESEATSADAKAAHRAAAKMPARSRLKPWLKKGRMRT